MKMGGGSKYDPKSEWGMGTVSRGCRDRGLKPLFSPGAQCEFQSQYGLWPDWYLVSWPLLGVEGG